jgi:hypothetical protein
MRSQRGRHAGTVRPLFRRPDDSFSALLILYVFVLSEAMYFLLDFLLTRGPLGWTVLVLLTASFLAALAALLRRQ